MTRLKLQGGEPDVPTVAKMVLNDFQRGRLPYFVKPPGCEEAADAPTGEETNIEGNPIVQVSLPLHLSLNPNTPLYSKRAIELFMQILVDT